jgi:outer membrane protein TolC
VNVESVPLDAGSEYPLDLSTALALVAGQNAEVQHAQWRVQEAYAQLDGAEALWLPSIQAGVSYHRHDGNLQASDGTILDVNRSSLQGGFGAGAVGAGAVPNPGLVMQFHTSDAIFAPRIAERTAWARGHAAKAELHDQLLAAALAYLEMLDAAQQQAIADETLNHSLDLAELTDNFAETGQGLQADADRMAAELAIRRNDLIRAGEAMTVASVRLAEVASFDLAARLVPIETTIVPIDLVPVEMDRQGLIALGLSNRPELQEAGCLVAEACERLRREKYAPLLPSVLLGASYGGFGGGLGDSISDVDDRGDFDALAVWQIRNLGVGERSARNTARAQIQQRKWEQVRRMDRVAREVAEAAARIESRRRQIRVSEQAIEIARLSYERNLSRIRDGQGLPIEALQSLQALDRAQREYLRAVVSYNQAQFELHRALGWPVTGQQ